MAFRRVLYFASGESSFWILYEKCKKKYHYFCQSVIYYDIEHLLLKEQRKKIQNCLVVYGSKEADRLKDTFRFNWKRKSFVWKLAYFRHIAIITRMANIWVIAHLHRRNWHSSSFSNWNESPYTYCGLLLVKECFCNSYPCWTFVCLISLQLLLFFKRNCNTCR